MLEGLGDYTRSLAMREADLSFTRLFRAVAAENATAEARRLTPSGGHTTRRASGTRSARMAGRATQEVVDVVLRGGVSSGSPDDADFSAALAQYRVPDRAVTACFTLQTRA